MNVYLHILRETKTFNSTEEIYNLSKNFSMDLPLNLQMQPLNQTSQSFNLQNSTEKDKTIDKLYFNNMSTLKESFIQNELKQE